MTRDREEARRNMSHNMHACIRASFTSFRCGMSNKMSNLFQRSAQLFKTVALNDSLYT